jgi:hypothetical protein
MKTCINVTIETIRTMPEQFTASELRARYAERGLEVKDTTLYSHIKRLIELGQLHSQGINKKTNRYTVQANNLRPQAAKPVAVPERDPRNQVERNWTQFRESIAIHSSVDPTDRRFVGRGQ